MGRPRRSGRRDWPPRLRQKNQNNKHYYYWVDPRTGKDKPLRCTNDLQMAKRRAVALNALLAEQEMDLLLESLTKPVQSDSNELITFETWTEEWLKLVRRRDITAETIKSRERFVSIMNERFGGIVLSEFPIRLLAELVDEYIEAGKTRTAQVIKSIANDIFKTAMQKGLFPDTRNNPASVISNISHKVQRSRLTLEEWTIIHEHTKQPWARNAQLLAVVTGQRLEDVARMKFRDVKDGFLHVKQHKTGNKLKIPLDLRLEALNMSVGDVIRQCRDKAVSHFLVHHHCHKAQAKPGNRVYPRSLTRTFREARNKSGLKWEKQPPSFHEQRSLSARLYQQQGIDAQILLGHRDPRMTAVYRDVRGDDWVEVKL
ncbi:MAG: tyrosine-type recombinase/integrase [Sedimenticola sp.]